MSYHKIEKVVIPFVSRQMVFDVPLDAEVVYVDRDTHEPGMAAIWYQFTVLDVENEGPDEGPDKMKTWTFGVFSTGEGFPDNAVYVGTLVVYDYAWHVLKVRPDIV